MTHTDEQRAIIARMDEINKRIKALEAAYHATVISQLNARLLAALDHSNALGALHAEYGAAHREYLSTL